MLSEEDRELDEASFETARRIAEIEKQIDQANAEIAECSDKIKFLKGREDEIAPLVAKKDSLYKKVNRLSLEKQALSSVFRTL